MGTAPVTAPEVDAYLAKIATLLVDRQRPVAADALRAEAGVPSTDKPVVVVAGEVKRGKSTLVNALLGQDSLSPTGVDVVTACPIVLSYAPRPEATVQWYGAEGPQAVSVDEARALVRVADDRDGDRDVVWARFGVPSPRLHGLDLVDTPGAGGLDSGHGALTLQSLRGAAALVFVTEAGAQLRAAELDFLRKASSRIETVIFVLTKTDRHRGWRAILEDNRQILADKAPRFATCPVIPVSAALALRGQTLADPIQAADIRRESGLTALEEALDELVVARAAVLSDANAVRAGLTQINVLERVLLQERAALSPDAAAAQGMAHERARLASLQEDKAQWPQVIDTEIRRLTLERTEQASRGTAEIRRRYDDRLKAASKSDQETLPGEFMADLTALASSLNEGAAERLSATIRKVLADMDSASEHEAAVAEMASASLQAELDSFDFDAHGFSVSDRLGIVQSFSSGHSLASLLTGSGLITTAGLLTGPFALVVGAGLGGLYAFTAFRSKRRQLFAGEFSAWMRDQAAQAQLSMNNTFARAMIDIQAQLRSIIKDALSTREKEITAALEAAKAVLAEQSSGVQRAREALDRDIAQVRDLKGEARTLLSGMGLNR